MKPYTKTVVSEDHYFNRPSLLMRLKVKIWGGRIFYDKKKGCWCEQYKVNGRIENGWFYPDFMEAITYKIFWPYGHTKWDNPPSGYEHLKINII